MIQRIQTVYLLGVIALIAGCFFSPIAQVAISGQISNYYIDGLIHQNGTIFNHILSFFLGFSTGITLLSIFLYKRREKQMLFCKINIILLIVTNIAIFALLLLLKNEGTVVSYCISVAFPAIAAILSYLAYRGVKKDDDLVRSYDRLR